MKIPSLLDAIRVVKENERIATKSYADAAQEIRHSMGRDLFEQLSKFEAYHYAQLTALEKSLEETGEFIDYQGKEFPLPPTFDIVAAEEPNKKSLMQIITEARELERQSEKAYAKLADKLTDPQGHEMFRKLAEEEHSHYLILNEAFWSLNNLGVWKWSRP
jgi:rubrerythrin